MRDDMRGDVDAVAKPTLFRTGPLPTTGSWHSLPRHTLRLMDDAMAHVDGERGAVSSFAPACEQARSPATTTATATTADDDAAAAPLGAGARQSTTKLNQEAALEIFQAKRCNRGKRSRLSTALGRRYGITAKAVRDIWNGRTWANVTKPLWTAEDLKAYEVRKMKRDHHTPTGDNRKFHPWWIFALWGGGGEKSS
jgi:hypothetical protein